MDVAGGEPAPLSIPLALPPSSGQSLHHSDNLPGLETQSLLVLLAAERIQSFVVGSGHGGELRGAAVSCRHTSRGRTKLVSMNEENVELSSVEFCGLVLETKLRQQALLRSALSPAAAPHSVRLSGRPWPLCRSACRRSAQRAATAASSCK